jgi:hypothetical protein
MYTFDSKFRVGPQFGQFTQEQVKNEPMFFNSDFGFCARNAGPITKAFIETFVDHHVVSSYANYIFDSRVHMLMPGWFPCIPGFHHDDVPRGENGQPNYDSPEYLAQHCMGLVNGEICPTEFAEGKAIFEKVPEGEIVYKHWHKEVEKKLIREELLSTDAPSNHLVYFDWQTWHQGTRAVKNGWRWFGRISWNTGRKATNEIRRQVQVYMDDPFKGW